MNISLKLSSLFSSRSKSLVFYWSVWLSIVHIHGVCWLHSLNSLRIQSTSFGTMILSIAHQKSKSMYFSSKEQKTLSSFLFCTFLIHLFFSSRTFWFTNRLFESVARSCLVVKSAAAAQQQNVENELQECNWKRYMMTTPTRKNRF